VAQQDVDNAKSELESAQAVYKRALEGYDQIMFASGGHDTNVTFVSRATPPVKPSKPKVLTGLILGCMVAAFLGLGFEAPDEDRSVREPGTDDLDRHLGRHRLPVGAWNSVH
jgi:uncharacterized protein involved in exopolysaccharide biosynthesis